MKTNERTNGKKTRKKKSITFDAETFLQLAGVAKTMMEFARNATLFSQGDSAKNIMYIQSGGVKLSVVSNIGKEAVVGMLSAGDFIGEGGLAGQPFRMATATALTPVAALVIENKEMFRLLHAESRFSDHFVAYMLKRNVRIEEDLIDHLFNSSEKRLARTLLLLPATVTRISPKECSPKYLRRRLEK